MAKDYKHNRNSRNKPLPGWIWMLTGIALGLSVAFFVYLDSRRAGKETRSTVFNTPREQQNALEQEQPPVTKRKFDFYTLLPELEVLVPEPPRQEPYQPPSTATPPSASVPQPDRKKPTTPTSSTAYTLQVGSFQKHGEADSLKAKLALLGVESNIQTVSVDHSTWHRVRVGPYRDRQRLNQVRAKLRKNNIDSMLMMSR